MKRSNKIGRKAEELQAKESGGRRISGSGNKPHAPGDVGHRHELEEVKATDSSQYTFKLDTWKKAVKEAHSVGKDPILTISIQGTRLVVLDYDYYRAWKEEMNEYRNQIS